MNETASTMSFSANNATMSPAVPRPKYPEAIAARSMFLGYMPFIFILGTVGNMLSIRVLVKKKMRNNATVFLVALAIADTCALVFGGMRWWVMFLIGYDLGSTSTPICGTLYFLLFLSVHVSAWCVSSVSIQRFICVYFPVTARRICQTRNSVFAVGTIFCLFVILDSHHVYTYEAIPEKRLCIPKNQHAYFVRQIYTWIHFFSTFIIPGFILVITNFLLIRKLVATRKQVQTANDERKSRITHVMTRMSISISVIFLALIFPVTTFLIVEPYYSKSKDPHILAKLSLASTIAKLIYLTNNAVNFILYCISGKRFRDELKSAVCRRSRVDADHVTTENKTNTTVNSNVP